jgi:diaminohydroxyphosphoribosylaminopyrimidine deaminase / 5-amino-6-(5-phosphoribosylamino)uracil reductase
MVCAGTVRVDDPQLTVRPAHDRRRPYVRVVACQSEGVSARSRIFTKEDGYAKTIVLVAGGRRERSAELRAVADVVEVGPSNSTTLDLAEAMKALRARDIFSVLCEGGPRLAASLLASGCVDRLYWAIAPRFVSGAHAVAVLSGADLSGVPLRFDRVVRAGPDVIISGVTRRV